jgi:hypothetical protein
MMENQLMYERHKRELHNKRNRRLLRKITNAETLEENNKTRVRFCNYILVSFQKKLFCMIHEICICQYSGCLFNICFIVYGV